MVQAPSLPDQPFSPSVQIRLAWPHINHQSPSDHRSFSLSASASESTFRLHHRPQPYGFGLGSHQDQSGIRSVTVRLQIPFGPTRNPLRAKGHSLDSVRAPREDVTCSPAPLHLSSPNEELALRRLPPASDHLLALPPPTSKALAQLSDHVLHQQLSVYHSFGDLCAFWQ